MTLDRRSFLIRAGLVVPGLALTGFTQQEMPDPGAPVHIQNDDPGWTILNRAKVSIDEAKGLMTAVFDDAAKAMDGKPFTIGGFMLPLDASQSFTHFVLTRRNTTCAFCPPNEPTEAIEIFTDTELSFTQDEYRVAGTLELVGEASWGLFYRIHDAIVEPM